MKLQIIIALLVVLTLIMIIGALYINISSWVIDSTTFTPTKKDPFTPKPEDKLLKLSDQDSSTTFFNISAYNKIPVDPEPDISPIEIVSLSPLAGKYRNIDTTPSIDRL